MNQENLDATAEAVAEVADSGCESLLASRYDEGWQGRVYRWLGRRVELLARRVGYTNHRFDVRYHVLDPFADWLVFKAILRGLRSNRGL